MGQELLFPKVLFPIIQQTGGAEYALGTRFHLPKWFQQWNLQVEGL